MIQALEELNVQMASVDYFDHLEGRHFALNLWFKFYDHVMFRKKIQPF